MLSRLRDLFSKKETEQQQHRASPENPSTNLADPDSFLTDYFGGETTDAGVRVDGDTAIAIGVVYQCVNMLTSDFAKLPTNVYKRLDSNHREKDRKHQAFYLLRHKPNDFMTSGVWKRTLLNHALMWGNGYAAIIRDNAGRPVEMITLMPDRTVAERKNGVLRYKTLVGEDWIVIKAEDMFHLKGMSYDGVTGYSIIALARESLGLAIAAESYGAKFFANGAVASGVLSYPGALSPQAAKNLVDSFEAKHKGFEKAHKTILLEEGTRYQPISIPPNDAQFIETRKLQRREIAGWFNIPPARLGDTESAGFETLEQQNEAYLESTLDPWLVSFEEEANDKLLTEEEKRKDTHFVETVRAAILRTDTLSRYRAWAIGRQWGFLSVNDIRRKENEPPIGPEGDIYLIPANMIPADKADELGPDTNGQSEKNPPDGPGSIDADRESERSFNGPNRKAQRQMLQSSLGRATRRLTGQVSKLAKSRDNWEQRVDDILLDAEDSFNMIVRDPLAVIAAFEGDNTVSAASLSRRVIAKMRRDLLDVQQTEDPQEFDAEINALVLRWNSTVIDSFIDEILGAKNGTDD